MTGSGSMQEDGWRSIVLRGISYAGERAVRLLLAAAVGIVVARYLGPEGLGLLSYVQAVFELLTPIVLLGLPAVIVREFSTGSDWRATLASSLAVQAPAAVLVALVGFFIIALTRDFDAQAVLTAAAVTPLPLLALSQSVRAYLEATGRSRVILVAGVVAAVAASAIKITAVAVEADVWVFAFAGTVEGAIVALMLLRGVPARARLRALQQHARVSLVRDLTRESWPLLLSALAVTVYLRADLVMLAPLAGDQETGIYAAAVRLSEVWYFLPMTALAAVRPMLSRLHHRGADGEYRLVLQRFMSASTGAAYLAVAAILVIGPRLVTLLYGADYAAAAPVLQLHMLAAPFVFLGVTSGPWFIDRRLTRAALARTAGGAVTNVVLNLLLIPAWGARGAAVATLVSYAISGLMLNGLLRSGRPVFGLQLRALALRWTPGPRGS